jgi:hypothetical protein
MNESLLRLVMMTTSADGCGTNPNAVAQHFVCALVVEAVSVDRTHSAR